VRRVVLVTQHYLESKRKAGFHWLADAYWRAGWEVIFYTCYVSWISWLRGDRRFPRALLRRVTNEAQRMNWVKDRLASYVWFTPWHPANLRSAILNQISAPFFRRYGELPLGEIVPALGGTCLFVFESTPGLLLFGRFRDINPEARCVYRVSDDLRLLGRHPVVIEEEERVAGKFDLVSAPSDYIYRRFAHLHNAALHHHGLNKELYDKSYANPYSGNEKNAVFVGNSRFDHDFLERASRLCPEWHFHVIGPIKSVIRRANVTTYGEMPFLETVPYVKYADAGLHIIVYSSGAESFTDSLKVQQYTYCRLPIVLPEFLRSSRTNLFCYSPGDDESIRQALASAEAFDRRKTDTANIRTWRELAEVLAGSDLW